MSLEDRAAQHAERQADARLEAKVAEARRERDSARLALKHSEAARDAPPSEDPDGYRCDGPAL